MLGRQVALFIPGISKMNEQNGLVTDVDGTIYDATANQMRAKGYNVVVVDLINPAHSNKFNPLKGLQLNDDRIDELLETIFSKEKPRGIMPYLRKKESH